MELESKNNGMFGRKKSPAYYALGIVACLAMIFICLIPQPEQSMFNYVSVKILLTVVALAGIGINIYHLKQH